MERAPRKDSNMDYPYIGKKFSFSSPSERGVSWYWKTDCRTGTMYGMLLESVQHFVRKKYGDRYWKQVLEAAGMRNMEFATHKRYNDEIMVRLAAACSTVLQDRTKEEYMAYFGKCFVDFFSHYGYDSILRVSGRYFRDFLHGIDNLHETMRFSYPKMISPSFSVTDEDANGCVLHYRTKRTGFTHYVIGQLKECALQFYNTHLGVDILDEKCSEQGLHVIYRLNFENKGFTQVQKAKAKLASDDAQYPDVPACVFFQVFPFCLVYNSDMVITNAGQSLSKLFPGNILIGLQITEQFGLRRPQVDFTWDNALQMQTVIFELESRVPVKSTHGDSVGERNQFYGHVEKAKHTLLLKGQMKYMEEFKGIAFLCTPLLGNLEEMEALDIYINDLPMHDSSRDFVMAGSQHASRLEYSIEKQVEKSQQIKDNLERLDAWQQLSDNLLCSMIPKSIAQRLKMGDDPINTCEIFDQVTIMFSYMVNFDNFAALASPTMLIEQVNSVFTILDSTTDQYNLFKVETVGDAAYMVAGGVPDHSTDHARSVALLALEFIDQVHRVIAPIGTKEKLELRIGIHSGGVVAGVVGVRTPQYCLFGDTVNTASRMQTTGVPGRIHVSETTHKFLENTELVTKHRGHIHVKGKGLMNTYWLAGKDGDPTLADTMIALSMEQGCQDEEFVFAASADDFLAYKEATGNHTTCHNPETEEIYQAKNSSEADKIDQAAKLPLSAPESAIGGQSRPEDPQPVILLNGFDVDHNKDFEEAERCSSEPAMSRNHTVSDFSIMPSCPMLSFRDTSNLSHAHESHVPSWRSQTMQFGSAYSSKLEAVDQHDDTDHPEVAASKKRLSIQDPEEGFELGESHFRQLYMRLKSDTLANMTTDDVKFPSSL